MNDNPRSRVFAYPTELAGGLFPGWRLSELVRKLAAFASPPHEADALFWHAARLEVLGTILSNDYPGFQSLLQDVRFIAAGAHQTVQKKEWATDCLSVDLGWIFLEKAGWSPRIHLAPETLLLSSACIAGCAEESGGHWDRAVTLLLSNCISGRLPPVLIDRTRRMFADLCATVPDGNLVTSFFWYAFYSLIAHKDPDWQPIVETRLKHSPPGPAMREGIKYWQDCVNNEEAFWHGVDYLGPAVDNSIEAITTTNLKSKLRRETNGALNCYRRMLGL